ncbi:DUF3011 domain-containing protein [Lysobacter sp. HDW10]|uniref:DUF3011 domain-containing protein n=1 Tax=Lysobacter sp. HDW10 TaxID=2714936 RepID=UPI001408E937|nr:DUF3011 domain-containing protein [Lysobacter sp. HDW10]QIK81644.1 DUF3011 domain-containing protein [Lysobacter sp. HDW10]
MNCGLATALSSLGCLLVAAAWPSPAYSGDIRNLFRKPEAGKVVRCESRDMAAQFCKAETSGGVQVLRQLSKTSCIENKNWRTTGEGIEVSGGCRADFNTGSAKHVYGNQVILCESVGRRWKLCAADTSNGVNLVRQVSDESPCIRNQSWGVRSEGVWVASGCRAEFSVGDPIVPPETGEPARITRCDSENGMRTRCRLKTGKGVRLVQRISSSPCTFGSTWGFDESEIWVRRGCRAEFQIDVEPRDIEAKPQIPADARLVKCESEDNRTHRCDIAPQTQVQIKEQVSKKVCEEGKSWRVEKDAIVVKSGCRAVFAVW